MIVRRAQIDEQQKWEQCRNDQETMQATRRQRDHWRLPFMRIDLKSESIGWRRSSQEEAFLQRRSREPFRAKRIGKPDIKASIPCCQYFLLRRVGALGPLLTRTMQVFCISRLYQF